MAIEINDGKGRGFTAGVDSENRLMTDAITKPLIQRNNEEFEKSYSLSFDAIDPVGADDYFVYIKNTGTKNIHVTEVTVRSTVAGSVEIHEVTGTASFTADADITLVNRTVGGAANITVTAKTDTNTTGLTNQGVLRYIRCAAVDTDYDWKIDSHLILPPGQALALLWDTATGALSGTITIYEDQAVSA